MIQYCRGDIFLTKSDAIAHGCNCMGVMGSGIAKTVKYKYPDMFKLYKDKCKKGEFKLGDVFLYKGIRPWIFNLATQKYYGKYADTKIENINKCLIYIANNYIDIGIKSLSIPLIGCGLGGLEWIDLKPAVENIFDPINLKVYIYDEYIKDLQFKEM